MTKQLKLTSLLLLVTSLTFAQQSIVNTSKSNVKDKAVVDTVKKTVPPTTQAKPQSIVVTTRSNIKDKVAVDTVKKNEKVKYELPRGSFGGDKIITDSSKTPVTTTEQARTTSNPVIPGIGTVVKKNPGGGASRVGTTNDKGEVVFTIKEKGDYTITLINDGGGAAISNNNAAAMSKGGPVIGVKVGLGKNPPGGSTHFATTNDKGEAEFKNLEVGSYKIVVQQADRATNTTKPALN